MACLAASTHLEGPASLNSPQLAQTFPMPQPKSTSESRESCCKRPKSHGGCSFCSDSLQPDRKHDDLQFARRHLCVEEAAMIVPPVLSEIPNVTK
jgi:hypothetical protein